MKRLFYHLSKTQVTSYVLFFLSAIILLAVIVMNFKVDVLKDWRLVLPQQKIHVGDKIVVQSLYTKLRDVTGKSVRYIECRNTSGVYIRYPVSEAVSNRASGTSGTGIIIVIPETIPETPAKCRVNITIDYEVYKWRHVIESKNSDEFLLLPAIRPDEVNVEQETNRTQAQGSASQNQSYSYPNSTPKDVSAQRNISQGDNTEVIEETPLEPTPEPTEESRQPLIQRILNPITNLLGGN